MSIGSIVFAVVFLGSILFSSVSAQKCNRFKAEFTVTAPTYSGGLFRGTCYYDWTTSSFLLDVAGLKEWYIFNGWRGYPLSTIPASQSQFSSQYVYKSSKYCDCETAGLPFAMPVLFDADKSITAVDVYQPDGGQTSILPLGQAKVRLSTSLVFSETPYNLISTLYILADGTPAGFLFKDQRTFTFTNLDCSAGAFENSVFAVPTGCKCGKPIDIVLSLDRTGSIAVWEFLIQHDFVRNIAASFEYGPLKTNLGIVNWNSQNWETIKLTDGTSKAVVDKAVEGMGCCKDNLKSTDSCCCCGTPIGGGLYLGGKMLTTSTRKTATKVLLLLTDGCQNHNYTVPADGSAPFAKQCACGNEKACATDSNCVGDIALHYKWVTSTITGVVVIVIGVGDDTTICKDQLNRAAGNIAQNVFNPTSWEQLKSIVTNIAGTACTLTDQPCDGCCGMCVCGQCITATECAESGDKCNPRTLNDATKCCALVPVNCPDPGPCFSSSCDKYDGCLTQPTPCPDSTSLLCKEYYCNTTLDTCLTKVKDPLPAACDTTTINKPDCVVNTECDDGNPCTDDACVNDKCVFTKNESPFEDTKCINYTCSLSAGWIPYWTATCNDNNNCTTDTCDPKTGCVYTPVECPNPKDDCMIKRCSPIRGCYEEPKNCSAEVAGNKTNCTIPACVNGTCTTAYVCAAPPFAGVEDSTVITAVAVSIGVGAVVGIVVAAVVGAAALGGAGAFAYAQAAGGGGATMVANNPLFKAPGSGGGNPLYKPS